ncbi:MAG TPA: biosynthetic peptidoglycan transglycosylase [Trebonia sp.]
MAWRAPDGRTAGGETGYGGPWGAGQEGGSPDDLAGYTRPLPAGPGWKGPPGSGWEAPRARRTNGYGPDGYGPNGYGRYGGRRRGRRILRRLTFTVVTLVVIVAIGIGALWVSTPSASEATQLASQQAKQHGIAYPGPAVPANFSRALVATEDHRYYTEQGVDPYAVARFLVSKVTGNTSNQGGATLEQQLAKMLYTPGEAGVNAEVKQIVLAYKLDVTYSKTQILDLYAEVAYYGHGYYGLQAASCGYFGHPAADLTPVQGAMLAGAVNAPTIDDPIDNPQQAYARLTHVVGRMVTVGDITQAQGKKMLNSSLGIVPRSQAGC